MIKKNIILLPILGMLVLISILAITITPKSLKKETKPEQPPRPEHPFAAKQQEWLKTVNHDTWQFPDKAIWNAIRELESQGKLTRPNNKNTRGEEKGWYPINDYFANLCISKLTYDPNNLNEYYFCTGEGWRNSDGGRGAGVWKSSDAGETWNQLTSTDIKQFNYCQDMAVHPVTSDVYVATREGGLQRSEDGGNTWQQVLGAGNGSQRNDITDIEFTQNGGIFVCIGIYAPDGIYYSDNGDSGTWVKKTTGFPSNVRRIELATAPSEDSIAYAIPVRNLSYDQKIDGVFKTTNKGDTWTEVANPGGDYNFARTQGWYDLIVAVDPNDPNVVVAGGINLWKSNNGGISWKQISWDKRTDDFYVHVDQHEIMFLSSDTVYFGNDGGVWKCNDFKSSDNGIPTIYNVNHTYNVTQYYSADIHPEEHNYTLVGGTQDNGSNITTGYFVSDHYRVSGGDGSFCAFNYNNGDILYTSRQYNHVYRFTNGDFLDDDNLTNPYLDENSVSFINPIEMDPNDPEILYMASYIGLWRLKNASTANRFDWEKATRTYGRISAIGISKSSPNTVFLGRTTGGNVYRVDGADQTDDSYRPVNTDINGVLPSAYASCVCVDRNDANHLIVTYSNYGIKSIWESQYAMTDSATWTSVEGDLPDIPVRWAMLHPDNPEVCYIATELGVFYTNKLQDSNTVWLPSKNGMPNTRVDMLRLRESDYTVVAATHGRGLFTGKIKQGTDYNIDWLERGPKNIGGRTRTIMVDPNDPTHRTVWAGSVSGGLWKTNNIDSIGFVYSIDEAKKSEFNVTLYPNPVVSTDLNLEYDMPAADHVSISIYSITGEFVKSIFKKNVSGGKNKFSWAPASAGLSSGTYFIVLNSGNYKSVRKFVFLP